MSSVLRVFLRNARSALSRGKVRIVIGNEASDVDSIVSSLCAAYLKNNQVILQADSMSSISTDTNYVPVVFVPRSILKLRREAQILLQYVGVDLEDLICLDEIDITTLSERNNLQSLILTDHNSCSRGLVSRFPGGENETSTLVEMILDHHKDTGDHKKYLGNKDSVRRIAFDDVNNKATAGSACTLVAELLEEWGHSAPTENYVFPATTTEEEKNKLTLTLNSGLQDISVLLQGGICIDTQNMDPQGVGTVRDEKALTILDKHIADKIDRNTCFHALRNAKYDQEFWERLNVSECLNIDYKQFQQTSHGIASVEVGISSILMPLSNFMKKSEFGKSLDKYMTCPTLDNTADTVSTAPLEMLIVMSSVVQPTFSRQLLVASHDKEHLDAFISFLHNESNIILQLEEIKQFEDEKTTFNNSIIVGDKTVYIKCFNQRNSVPSRKQLAPLVQRFYKDMV
jgi:inorganic pyrophosphatase/exopolyphosphatase